MIGAVVGTLLQAMLPFTTLVEGGDSRMLESREVGIRTVDEWRGLWKEHRTGALPDVDFSKSMVVGVFSGSRPTTGCRVEIVSLSHVGGVVVVEYRERTPAPDALVAQMLTSPFHLVSVPRKSGVFRFKRLVPPG